MRSVAAIAAVLTAVLVTAPAALPQSSLKVERRAALEAAVVREMNRVRGVHGLRPLRAAPSLRSAARDHSLSMLELGYFSHDSADGTAFSDRIKRHYTSRGWRSWSVGEALLASQGKTVDAPAIVAAWLASPPTARSSSRRPGATPASERCTHRVLRASTAAPRRSS